MFNILSITIRNHILAILTLLAVSSELWAQPEPEYSTPSDQTSQAIWSSSNVWHKNMELIRPYQTGGMAAGEHFQSISITVNGVDKQYVVYPRGPFGGTPHAIELIDVTNPDEPPVIGVQISATSKEWIGSSLTSREVVFQSGDVWKDRSTGLPLSGHVFGIFTANRLVPNGNSNDIVKLVFTNRLDANNPPSNGIEARFVVIDFTAALEQVRLSSNKHIVIDDLSIRNSAHIDGSSSMTNAVYVGHVPVPSNDYADNVHTVSMEKRQGIFIVSPLKHRETSSGSGVYRGYIDCYSLRYLAGHPECSTNVLMRPNRLEMSGLPIECRTDNNSANRVTAMAHETHGHTPRELDMHGKPTNVFLDDENRLLLNIASYGRPDRNAPAGADVKGGAIILELQYDDPQSTDGPCEVTTLDNLQYWRYNDDRESPQSKASSMGLDNYLWNSTHSVDAMHFDHYNHFFITANELASPVYDLKANGDPRDAIGTFTVNPHGDFYGDFLADAYYTKTTDAGKDHRRLGNYLRIWGSTDDHKTIKGAGTDLAPMGSYDVPEQSVADRQNGLRNPRLHNQDVARVSVTASGTDKSRAPNSVHHARTYYDATGILLSNSSARSEAFVAGYSQGVRVIDLANFIYVPPSGQEHDPNPNPTEKTVIERAYFDYTPTLNYDPTSRYFYAMADRTPANNQDASLDSKWKGIIPAPNYFVGPMDAFPDQARDGLAEDVIMIYTYGISGKQAPWMQTGGWMMLRYFRDKIGGTISGYTGTSNQTDPSHREVNLQGTFEVSRNTTIANGATVYVLDNSVFNQASTNTITVEGNMIISSRAGRSTMNVPINVTSTGCLIVDVGAEVDFLRNINVAIGGQLILRSGSTVVFAQDVQCNGMFKVEGENVDEVEIYGPVNTSRFPTGTSLISMKGNPSQYTGSHLKLRYGNFHNIGISAEDVKGEQPYVADECSFVSDLVTRSGSLLTMKFLSKPDGVPGLRSLPLTFRKIKVRNSLFQGMLVSPSTSLRGLWTDGWRSVEITGSTFEALGIGAYVQSPTTSKFSENTVTGCRRGLWTFESSSLFCLNDLSYSEFGIQSGGQNFSSVFRDNAFENHKTAVYTNNSGSHYYRGNDFLQSNIGIRTYGADAYLKNFPPTPMFYPPGYLVYGRNHFTYSSPSGWWTNLSSAPYSTDIWLATFDKAFVDCGYNEFSANSAYHVYGNGYNGTLDVSDNWWRDGSSIGVRTNLSWTGSDLDDDGVTTETCSALTSEDGCSVGCAGNGGEWIGYIEGWNDLHNQYESLRLGFYNFNPSNEPCIIGDMWEAMEAARIIDTVPYYRELLNDYETIADTSLASARIKSTALLLKGLAYEYLGVTDSAVMTYRRITDTLTTSLDSMTAAWKIQLIGARADTIDPYLAHSNYVDRVLADIRRVLSGGAAQKTTTDSDAQSTGFELAIGEPRPNPATSGTQLLVSNTGAAFIRISVVDLLGNEVMMISNSVTPAGDRMVSVSTNDLPEGTYFIRVSAAGIVKTAKFVVEK